MRTCLGIYLRVQAFIFQICQNCQLKFERVIYSEEAFIQGNSLLNTFITYNSAYNNSQSPDIFQSIWCLYGQNKFDLTHLLYIINGKVSVFLEDKVMSGQISTLIISTDTSTSNKRCDNINQGKLKYVHDTSCILTNTCILTQGYKQPGLLFMLYTCYSC